MAGRKFMKIILIGSPGSGKSTLAREIEKLAQIPILHLDKLWHTTDYSDKAIDWFIKEQEKFMDENESWVIDGNYFNSTIEKRLSYNDVVVVVIQVPRYKRIYRILKRSVKRRFSKENRPDMASNFSEKFDKEYLDFLKIAWNYDEKVAQRMLDYEIKNPIIIKNQRDRENFLNMISQ